MIICRDVQLRRKLRSRAIENSEKPGATSRAASQKSAPLPSYDNLLSVFYRLIYTEAVGAPLRRRLTLTDAQRTAQVGIIAGAGSRA